MVSPQPSHTASVNELAFAVDEGAGGPRWIKWAVVILLALLAHLLISLYQLNWQTASPPLQVELNPVDNKKIEAIREQWRREKSILLDKNKNPSAAEKPKDARYFSDKNIKVEKEQRAEDTNVMPKPGIPNPAAEAEQEKKTESKPKAANPAVPLPTLGNLGVPLDLNKKAPDPTPDQQIGKERKFAGEDGGDQAVLDKELPQGSENMLNAEESVYYSFYARMYEAIAPVWQSHIRDVAPQQRVAAGDYTTVVDVVLDKEGNLVGVRRVRSSGIPAFDQAVDSALQKAGHFPNPPKDLLNANSEVHTGWTFTVSLNQSTGLNYAPPSRAY